MVRSSVKRQLCIVLILSMVVFLIACSGSSNNTTPTPPSTTPSPTTPQAGTAEGKIGETFEEIVALAAEEAKQGPFVWWGSTPDDSILNEMVGVFNKRFGLEAKVNRVSLSDTDIPSRLLSEKQGGVGTVDVAAGNQSTVYPILSEDLIAKVDWIGLFSKELEGVQTMNDRLIDDVQGYGLEWRHLIYGFAYNTQQVSAQDAPSKWEDVKDPKWKGKIVADAALSPFRRLVLVLGKEETLKLAEELLGNEPIFAEGSTGTIQKIVSGEASFGILSLNSAVEQMKKGAPIQIVQPEPLASVDAQMVYVPKSAPKPNLARLFAAWMATEGMEISAPYGVARGYPGEPGPFGAYLAEKKLTPRMPANAQEVELIGVEMRKALADLVSSYGKK